MNNTQLCQCWLARASRTLSRVGFLLSSLNSVSPFDCCRCRVVSRCSQARWLVSDPRSTYTHPAVSVCLLLIFLLRVDETTWRVVSTCELLVLVRVVAVGACSADCNSLQCDWLAALDSVPSDIIVLINLFSPKYDSWSCIKLTHVLQLPRAVCRYILHKQIQWVVLRFRL